MIETVTVGAVSAALAMVGNGVSGGVSAFLAEEVGARVRRTLGRDASMPTTSRGFEELARRIHARMSEDAPTHAEWAAFLRSLPASEAALDIARPVPPSTGWFTDRRAVLAWLSWEASRPARGRPRVALLDGSPGIGTSAVALHWCAEHGKARFPHGQVYVDLRRAGGGEHGPSPSVVLRHVLEAMGVDAERMPRSEQGRADRYQELIEDKRVLVLVDHVSSVAQARPLVPVTPGSFLVLVRSGPAFALPCRRINVPPLRDRDAKRFLRKGGARRSVVRHRAQLPALLERCAGNAHALSVEKARLLADEPPSPASGEEPPLANPVHAAAQRVCAQLPAETVRLCRLTALADFSSFEARTAALAADVPVADASRMLAEAAEAQLVLSLPERRYGFRPEVRTYLERVAAAEDGAPTCSAAVFRMLEGLLAQARYAARAALGASWRVEDAPEGPNPYADEAAGMTALLAELDTLVRAVFLADEYQHLDMALSFARALWPLQLKAGRWDEVLPALQFAAERADAKYPETRTSGALHFQVAHGLGELKRWDEADEAVCRAVGAEQVAGHLRGEASCVELRGLLRLYEWRFSEVGEYLVEARRLYEGIARGEDGFRDVPRALALLDRHHGRELHGLGQLAEARAQLERALEFFPPTSEGGEAYNRARVLTDLAATLIKLGELDRARSMIDEAEGLLTPEKARPHLVYLAVLRRNCEEARPS